MAQMAVDLGIPFERIIFEPEADTTKQNGLYSAQTMARLGLSKGVLVTDFFHLSYALPVFTDAFEQFGLELYWLQVDNTRLAAAGLHSPYLPEVTTATSDRGDLALSPQIQQAVAEATGAQAQSRRRIGAAQHEPMRTEFDVGAALSQPNLLSYFIGIGAQGFGGNGNALVAHVASGVDARWKDWALKSQGVCNYGRVRVAGRDEYPAYDGSLWLRGERRVFGNNFSYLEAGGAFDRPARIEQQTWAGLGNALIFFEQLEARFLRAAAYLDVGYRYVQEKRRRYYPSQRAYPQLDFHALRTSLRFRYAPTANIILNQDLEFLYDLGDGDNVRLQTDTRIVAPLGAGFAIALALQYRYVGAPVPGADPHDTTTTAGLDWTF